MKLELAALVALGWLSTLAAAADGGAQGWITDAHGCKVANPHPGPNDSVDWSGACPEGLAEGKGQLRRMDNGRPASTYDGEMKAGRYSGQGVLTTARGVRYEGGFVDGLYAGRGTLSHPSGATYQGEFLAGSSEGACEITWRNGNRYEGDCKTGRMEGKGQIQFAGGDRYVGAMRANQAWGQGRYSWARGDSYEGAFIAGQPAGEGEYRFADGSHYKGGFSDGKPSGRGRLELPDGLGYEGNFESGAPTSPGAFFKLGGTAPEDSLQQRMLLSLQYAKPQSIAALREYVGVHQVCTVMARPELPVVKWKGNALFRVVATVRDGRVVAIETTPLVKFEDPAVRRAFVDSIQGALSAYSCPGNHVFEQEFEFAMR